MTFVLKEFKELNEHFNETVDIIIERDKKPTKKTDAKAPSIDDLAEPRRSELLFLKAVMEQIAKMPPAKAKAPAYGLMLLMKTDIHQNLGLGETVEGSQLYRRLNAAMGVDKTNVLSPVQKMLCYKELNSLFKIIYEDGDSRKGFKKEHPLQVVSLDKLMKLIDASYKLEEKSQNELMAALPSDGKTTADIKKYSAALVLATSKKWEDLKSEFKALVKSEFAEKKAATYEELGQPRTAQLQFLQAIIDAFSDSKLTNIKEAEKISILMGAMYIIRGAIAKEYRYTPLANDTIYPKMSPKPIVVHTGLTKILDATKATPEDIEAYTTSARRFMHYMIIERALNSKKPEENIEKDAIRSTHMFSLIKDATLQKNFLQNLFTVTQNIISTCRTNALEASVNKVKKEIEEAKPAKGGSSLFGNWGSWWKTTAPKLKAPEVPAETSPEAATSSADQVNAADAPATAGI